MVLLWAECLILDGFHELAFVFTLSFLLVFLGDLSTALTALELACSREL